MRFGLPVPVQIPANRVTVSGQGTARVAVAELGTADADDKRSMLAVEIGDVEASVNAENVVEFKTVTASERMKEIGWTGTVLNYIKAVTAGGTPLKSSGNWADRNIKN